MKIQAMRRDRQRGRNPVPGIAVVLGAWLLLQAPTAHAEGSWTPLIVLVLAERCAAQDPQFRTLPPLQAKVSHHPEWDWTAFDALPHSQCYRRRQWLPPELCESIRPLTESDESVLEPWRRAHAKQLFRLRPVLDFENDVLGRRRSADECPDIPPVAGAEMGDGGFLMVSEMCAAQDPRHRSGPMGQLLAQRPADELPGWPREDFWAQESVRPFFQCLKQRQWLPERFCQAVDAVSLGDVTGRTAGPALTRWIHAQDAELKRLEPVFDYVNDVMRGERPDVGCPDLELAKPGRTSHGQGGVRH